jgi:GNAT superfamily N-acetyltransferase
VNQELIIRVATAEDRDYAITITNEMESSAKARGTGIAKRSPEYVAQKMEEGKAVIALTADNQWVGFCYIETWEGEYVANSGLIVAPEFRKSGVAKKIKERVFQLSREQYPKQKYLGLQPGWLL